MDALLGLLCIGAIVGLFVFIGSAAKSGKRQTESRQSERRTVTPHPRSDQHKPPRPLASTVVPWTKPVSNIEVAGESYRRAEIAAAFRGLPVQLPNGHEIEESAVLVPDPHNPFDSNAVAVYLRGQHVGYLPASDAVHWHRSLLDLTMAGQSLAVESRAWARLDETHTVRARVTLRMPSRSGLLPANGLPGRPHVVLPSGSVIQVTKEDEHMESIANLLDPTGAEVPLAVTLHAIVDIRPRSAVDAVQVQVNGEPVGILSKASSDNLLPLVRHVAAAGRLPVARATLRGNTLKADITLNVAKAQDVDPAWVAQIGPAAPPKPRSEHRPQRPEPEW